MSIFSDRRNSPPVKDTGLRSPSLVLLKEKLQKEARDLQRMEHSLLSPEQIYPPIRKQLFTEQSDGAYSMSLMVPILFVYFVVYILVCVTSSGSA